ncbi:hypothetical protein C8Q73DRAFT_717963, partial [Cubamyces lactineus]
MGPRLVSLLLPRRTQVLAHTAIALGRRRSCTYPPSPRPSCAGSLKLSDFLGRNDLPLPPSIGAADLSGPAHSTNTSGLRFYSFR